MMNLACERGALAATVMLPSKQFQGERVSLNSDTMVHSKILTSVPMARVNSIEAFSMNSSAGRRVSRGTNFSGVVKSYKMASQFWGDDQVCGITGSRSLRKQCFIMCPFPGQSYRPNLALRVDARLFGPSIFNASKLRVLLLGSEKGDGKDDKAKLLQQPRIYTLTHSDITAKITLTVAKEINKAQMMGWYSRFQRDEIIAEWRRTKGETSLHVHCHVSGNNFVHRLIARLRFYIFQKELPLVLEAFIHGDKEFFDQHPEMQTAPVWVYCHSHIEEYNRVECWGPLIDASKRNYTTPANENLRNLTVSIQRQFPHAAVCLVPCECCSRHAAVIPVPESLNSLLLQHQEVSLKGFRSITKEGD